MHNRQVEGMWSSVLAGSERTLRVKSSTWRSEGSSTRRPGGGGGLVLGAHLANGGRGRAKGLHDDVPHRGGPCQAGLPAPIADSRSRPPNTTTEEGVEHVTRSMATNRAQVSSSTAEPA